MAGLLSTLLGGDAQAMERDPSDEFWYGEVAPPTASGAHVTPRSALRVSTVYKCIKVISESLASLPIKVYERQPNGDKREVTNHPLYDVLHDQPNSSQTAYQFKLMQQSYLLSKGYALAEIVEGPRGAVDQLIPIDPDNARPEKLPNGRVRWYVREESGRIRTLTQAEVWFIPGSAWVSDDGITTMSPLDIERQAVGDALAARDYSSRFWANDATPGGLIEWDGQFKDSESRRNWRRAWREAHGGANRGNTAILEHGMKYKPVTLTNEQAQFLDTRKYQDVDICGIYRVPPHKAGILDRATFSNIEQQAIEFVVDTMMPWFTCWEQAIKKDLLLGDRGQSRFFVEFKVSALLRGDILSRYQAYAIGRNWGWLSANDVRRMENSNSIGEQGDRYLEPTNMMPAGSPGEPSGQGAPRQSESITHGGGDSAPEDYAAMLERLKE